MFTMPEFLKTNPPQMQAGIVKKFVDSSMLLRVMPFLTRPQPGHVFNRQASLPNVTARAIGELPTHSQGSVDPGYEPHKHYSGTAKFDRYQAITDQSDRIVFELLAFAEALALNYDRDVLKGDSSSNVKNLNGLQFRCTDTTQNHLVHGDAAGTIANALVAKQMCRNPTHWIMGEGFHNKITLAAHNTSVGGQIERGKDEMGQEVTIFCGLPIVVVKRDASDTAILEFTEANTTTSVYCVSLRLDRLHGIQPEQPYVKDLGEDPSNGLQRNIVIDWHPGTVLEHPRSAVRWSGITNAALSLQ